MIKIADYIEELLQLNDPDYSDYDFLASSVLNHLRKEPDGQRIKEFLREKSLNELHDLIENRDKRLNDLLLSRFPDLRQEFDEWTSWQEGIDTSAMLTYEDVLDPYIIKQLALDSREEIIKIADFIEEFLNIDDYALNIAEVGVLEALKSDREGQKIRPFLKEKSLEIYDNLRF